MNCIAHRGFAGVNPENTLAAVTAAVDAGTDGIELDVRRCADGLVVIHDETVDRVTDATGPVESFTVDELAALSVCGSGEGVPTLDAVCRAVPRSVRLNLELKERGIARETVETAREHDCDLLLSSFSAAALSEVDDVPRAYLFYEDPDLLLKEARDLGCSGVHPHWHLCTETFVSDARSFGFEVNAWTVNYDELVADLAEVGVDGYITDDPVYCRGR